MEKILIVSYFFPPCNLTASQRTYAWAKYLGKYGYRPIIITRRWDHKINVLSDISRATPSELLHEEGNDYEVYYLPYHPNLRDRIYVRFGESKFSRIRKMFSFFELIFQHFFTFAIPYKNMFRFAEKLFEKDRSIKKVIISGNPFNMFKIGFNLQKKYGVRWVADYRDAWTTSTINLHQQSILFGIINHLDKHFEKKWVSTASWVSASSLPIADSINELTGIKSSALYNGFIHQDFDNVRSGKYSEFTITYVGTLYQGQKIEIFCEAFKMLVDSTPDIQAKLYFPGLSFYKQQTERVSAIMFGYENFFECTQRIEREKILEIEKRSHLLLHVAWDEHSGIIASKIYEYIASGTFIIIAPTDNGSIQEIVESSGCGICTKTIEETFTFLKEEYENYLKGKFRTNDTLQERVQQFSRENQVKHLAELLNNM